MAEITVTVDGVRYADHVEPRLLLVHYLREVVGKTGTPIGCDTSNCGACTVLLDGESVKSCSVLAVQADGADITTIQGLANGALHPLQRAFHEEHALQCGYCTPGMIRAASDLLRENPHPSDEVIRACAYGLRRNAMCSMPGSLMLSVQLVWPVMSRSSSLRRRPRPISRAGASVVSVCAGMRSPPPRRRAGQRARCSHSRCTGRDCPQAPRGSPRRWGADSPAAGQKPP